MNIARWMIYIGIGFLILGFLVWIGGKMHIPFGRLPGDIAIKKEKYAIYFPIVTSIFLSIFLTIVLNVIFWIFRK